MRKLSSFTAKILKWYQNNKRELPWRETTNPYYIWLSEIILQQTRINQGINYYRAFTDQYPTLSGFAEADEDHILKLWQGLGYYSRARNMHYTARELMTNHNGHFPDNYQDLIKLKGIGPYTAAAIASIAFNEQKAAVDGNVFRVLSRIFGIDTPIDSTKGRTEYTELAYQLMDKSHPGTFNQAMMDFGAIQCSPKSPQCSTCPFGDSCQAFMQNRINFFPVREKQIKIRSRYFNYLVITNPNTIFLQKRTQSDIWKNLYEFPLIETPTKLPVEELEKDLVQFFGSQQIEISEVTKWEKQVLSHQHIYYRFLYFRTELKRNTPPNLIEVNKKDIFNFAVPKPVEQGIAKIIRNISI